jgi:alpha-beta hydrolase superfamily lysophospholipase
MFAILRVALLLALPLAASGATAKPVTLTAADGVKVSAEFNAAPGSTRGIIVLFHMAGSNKSEYAPIAARLHSAGYSTLAIDQRSGGDAFGSHNATVAALGKSTGYTAALPDLEAALAFATDEANKRPVIIVGSSYSAALVFLLAAKSPGAVAGIVAFSPGEYLGAVSVKAAAAQVSVPVFVTSAASGGEISAAKSILAASPSATKVQYVPTAGVHGASTLREDANPKGAAANWAAVEAFLARF